VIQGFAAAHGGAINAFKHDLSLAAHRTRLEQSARRDPGEAYGLEHADQPGRDGDSVPEPRMISVSVWDKQMVGKVDRAIRESNLGFNPIVDGTTLRIPLPELNEQRRKELVPSTRMAMPKMPVSRLAMFAATAWIF
jgi:ribosome recycling factor